MGGSTTAPAAARVLLWAHHLAGIQTGIGRYASELSRALVRLSDSGRPALRYDLCSGGESRQPEWVPDGVGVCGLGPSRRLLHLSWATVRRPKIERLAGDAAVVHALLPAFPVPARAPLVVTVHDLFKLEHPSWFPRSERWAFRRAIEWAAEHAAAFVVFSTETQRRVTAWGIDPARIRVIRPGIGARFLEPIDRRHDAEVLTRHGLPPDTYVVAMGAMTKRENLPAAIAAIARLRRPLSLILVGPLKGGHEAALAAAEEQGVADRVRLTGFVPDGELPSILRGAVALVQPALDEGFGFPPLEAMAVGTPAIVAGSGAIPEVVGDAALIVAEADPDAWAEAIASLQAGGPRREELVRAGHERAARFTWAASAAAHADLYRSIAAG